MGMLTEFAALTLSRKELLEIQEALMMRGLVEGALRHEEGLEPVDRSAVLQRIEQLLGSNRVEAQLLEDRTEQELWQHAWYAFTEEWAWFRAHRDIMEELGTNAGSIAESVLEEMVHHRYHEKFNEYVEEVAMNNESGDDRKTKSEKRPTRS
jgi:hypothetical protein